MQGTRTLPAREYIFILSLKLHGYRLTSKRSGLKKKKGYICGSTRREDASGIDFWIKPPRSVELYQVQITQRGDRIFRDRNKDSSEQRLREFIESSELRLKRKRLMCRRGNILFVLVRDKAAGLPSRSIAWGDIKALRNALERAKNK